MIGQTVSHYRILGPLGEGGMGTVYLAEDTHLGRRVAIKFPSINSNSHDYRARFLREARAASELSHPGVATLFDYGETDDGRPFLVMELAKGSTLTQLMQKGELNLLRAVEIVTDVATALTVAHDKGVIHRDIKPSNIMIDDSGQVKVLDFGLAKQLNKDPVGSSEPEAPTLLSNETRSGIILGTPAYLSPEQAMGLPVDGRSDLFSLGIVLYEAITGRTPFSGSNYIEIAANVLHVEPPAPSKINPDILRELDFITLKALAKKVEKRYQSAREMIDDLSAVKERLELDSGQTIKRSPRMPLSAHSKTLSNISQVLRRPRIPISYILIGAMAVVGLGLVALRLWRPRPHQPTADAQRWYDVGTSALRDGAYYQASQALGRAIASDNAFILAHARLAEALVELDYGDRAKDELLRVNSADRSALSNADALYLDAIIATSRRDFGNSVSLYNQIAEQASDSDKPYVLVDLGRAHDKNNDPKKAIEAYANASQLNAQYPTPFLQLGILYGRQQGLANAETAFAKAEAIYQALGNLEGRAEVLFQRGALFNKLNKLPEAKVQLEQALALARAADNKSQEIKTLLQLSSVAVDMGDTSRAGEYLQQAVDFAQNNGLENLSARGLNDQGNNALIKGEYTKADKYFSEALQWAQRSKALSNEARARFSLASLRLQQNNADEALRYLEPALAFYRQGGYRSETSFCLTLLARANRQRGDYESANKFNEELLRLGQQSNDQSLIALAHSELGTGFARQERFPDALDHYGQAHAIYTTLGVERSVGFNLQARGNMLWQLGRYKEAQALLDEAATIADRPTGGYKKLSIEGKLLAAEIALSQGSFSDAKTMAGKVITLANTDFPDIAAGAKRIMGLAQAESGAPASGKQLAMEVVAITTKLNDPYQLGTAQLALAEAMIATGDSRGALKVALEAQQAFARGGHQESEWRAWLFAALATRNLGDSSGGQKYASSAAQSLAKLEQRWGTDNYNGYLGRPDIKRLRQKLTELTGAG
ncbi:MAG: protein kinase domain-containing protein [Pyrinomonadaceae bacterium]